MGAGFGFAVKLNKGDFVGRAALVRQKGRGLTRRLVMFTLKDPEPLLCHDEPIYRNGELVSANTHGAYAHLLGCAMGMSYLKNENISDEWITSGKYEIDVEGRLGDGEVHIKAPHDPQGLRLKK